MAFFGTPPRITPATQSRLCFHEQGGFEFRDEG